MPESGKIMAYVILHHLCFPDKLLDPEYRKNNHVPTRHTSLEVVFLSRSPLGNCWPYPIYKMSNSVIQRYHHCPFTPVDCTDASVCYKLSLQTVFAWISFMNRWIGSTGRIVDCRSSKITFNGSREEKRKVDGRMFDGQRLVEKQ